MIKIFMKPREDTLSKKKIARLKTRVFGVTLQTLFSLHGNKDQEDSIEMTILVSKRKTLQKKKLLFK